MKQLFVESPFFFGDVTHEKILHDVNFVGQFYAWLDGYAAMLGERSV